LKTVVQEDQEEEEKQGKQTEREKEKLREKNRISLDQVGVLYILS
jgi:hypothetical protein